MICSILRNMYILGFTLTCSIALAQDGSRFTPHCMIVPGKLQFDFVSGWSSLPQLCYWQADKCSSAENADKMAVEKDLYIVWNSEQNELGLANIKICSNLTGSFDQSNVKIIKDCKASEKFVVQADERVDVSDNPKDYLAKMYKCAHAKKESETKRSWAKENILPGQVPSERQSVN